MKKVIKKYNLYKAYFKRKYRFCCKKPSPALGMLLNNNSNFPFPRYLSPYLIPRHL